MQPETPNLADAILLALSNAGWIGALVERTTPTPTKLRRCRAGGRIITVRPNYMVPLGVAWRSDAGRWLARVHVPGHPMVALGTQPATPEGAERCGRAVVAAKAVRDAGGDLDAIKAAGRAVLESDQ